MGRLTLIEEQENKINEFVKPYVDVKGKEWTTEALLLKALVNRLGGRVTIHSSEIKEEGGLIIQNKGEGVYIETDEYDKEAY